MKIHSNRKLQTIKKRHMVQTVKVQMIARTDTIHMPWMDLCRTVWTMMMSRFIMLTVRNLPRIQKVILSTLS